MSDKERLKAERLTDERLVYLLDVLTQTWLDGIFSTDQGQLTLALQELQERRAAEKPKTTFADLKPYERFRVVVECEKAATSFQDGEGRMFAVGGDLIDGPIYAGAEWAPDLIIGDDTEVEKL